MSQNAKYASIASVVYNHIPDLLFVGFYIVENGEEIHIGPYQSKILASAIIKKGKGVCGTAWEEKKAQIWNNIKECKNYIACDSETKSEIVIPVLDNNKKNVVAVFDIDSVTQNRFLDQDVISIEKIVSLLYK
ncbi:hypothetical protein IMG5_095040 [Ichthyophthirius multifiliis]|uniref:GAF domain-containing protein n=1 Tax=Ichthyophthirius multifiliis TaxID=5932 RepID=G0QRL8_ICHMU|nr:hypothetical protein IMG5_095040 [Ichthyophthirius multifiliis]EGR32139.1 hypothetical protein IMG5_095040 [Ichthyophthirius multifiliis]|eukprot:XP_004035625.1 hypothetical protein IMG5_095040 [Ichthyophthirius multifiliis]